MTHFEDWELHNIQSCLVGSENKRNNEEPQNLFTYADTFKEKVESSNWDLLELVGTFDPLLFVGSSIFT